MESLENRGAWECVWCGEVEERQWEETFQIQSVQIPVLLPTSYMTLGKPLVLKPWCPHLQYEKDNIQTMGLLWGLNEIICMKCLTIESNQKYGLLLSSLLLLFHLYVPEMEQPIPWITELHEGRDRESEMNCLPSSYSYFLRMAPPTIVGAP